MAKVGIIGTGWGARVQVPAFREAGLEVVAIAGSDAEKTKAIGGELGVTPFSGWRELLDSARVDLVSIVTPPDLHAEMAISALESGHHVLCEKPTALSAAEAAAMVEAAGRHGSQLALIDHELRFLPSWRSAKSRMESIGAVRYIEVRYSSPGRGDRQRAWNWWSDADRGGGVWGAVGSHFIDAIRYLAGEVISVAGHLHTFIDQRPDGNGGVRGVTSDDFAAMQLEISGGARASIQLSVVAGVDEPTTFTVHGEEGSLRLIEERLLLAERGGEWREQIRQEEPDVPGNSPGGPFGTATVYLGRALQRALDDGDRAALEPAATFLDGLRQQQVLDAGRRSARNRGCLERLD
jgi:predicted dehydrogenase